MELYTAMELQTASKRELAHLAISLFVLCSLQDDGQGAGRAEEGARLGRAPHPALGTMPAAGDQPRDGPDRGAGTQFNWISTVFHQENRTLSNNTVLCRKKS